MQPCLLGLRHLPIAYATLSVGCKAIFIDREWLGLICFSGPHPGITRIPLSALPITKRTRSIVHGFHASSTLGLDALKSEPFASHFEPYTVSGSAGRCSTGCSSLDFRKNKTKNGFGTSLVPGK